MSVHSPVDVIIVGGGPGGLTAGLYCMRAALESLLFEKGTPGGQVAISKDVENYPGLESVTGFDLSEKLLHHAQSYGLEVVREEVERIKPGDGGVHSVELANGGDVQAHALILAMGGTAKKLGVPGEEEYLGKGVSYCATCDGFFFREKVVVVVGGGDTAIEEALYLSKIASKVYVAHRRSSFKASKILQARLMADPKIEVIWNAVVTDIKGDGREVRTISLEDVESGGKRELSTEGVFIFIGYSPNNQLVPSGVLMNDNGCIITDEKCETSIPGIFAIGDIRQKYANQIAIAVADGCTAALAAARYVEAAKFGDMSLRA